MLKAIVMIRIIKIKFDYIEMFWVEGRENQRPKALGSV